MGETTMHGEHPGGRIGEATPRLVLIARASGAVSGVLGLSALLGWILGIALLATFGVGKIPMAPSTAVLFLLFGFLFSSSTTHRSVLVRAPGAWLVCSIMGATVSLALLLLSGRGIFLSGERMGLSLSGTLQDVPVGHMSPLTASCFLLISVAMIALLKLRGRASRWGAVAIVSASIVFLVSMVLVVAYVLGGPLLYGSGVIPPALPTSLAFLAMAISAEVSAFDKMFGGGDSRAKPIHTKTTYILLLIFLLAVTGIIASGYVNFREYQTIVRSRAEDTLAAIAEWKAGVLTQWRSERLGDASTFLDHELFSDMVRSHLHPPREKPLGGALRKWMETFQTIFKYERVFLMDEYGACLASVPEIPEPDAPHLAPDAREAMRTGRSIFVDFRRSSTDQPPRLYLLTPVSDRGQLMALLVMQIDPSAFLYPLLRKWPASTQSGETLLVRSETDGALILNPLAHTEDADLRLRFAGDLEIHPTAMAVRGRKGIVEGVDHRGQPVLAALRAIPDSPWFLVAQMNLAEVNAPARDRLWALAALVSLILFAAGGGAGVLWWQQGVRFHLERQAVSQALAHSEQRFQTIFQSAQDGILAADTETLRIVSANRSISRMLGYSRDELLSMGVNDIHPSHELARARDLFEKSVQEHGSLAPDVPMRRKDGSVFFADINASLVQLDGRTCLLGIFRDITERKRAEDRIQHLNAVLRGIRNINHLITREKTRDRLIQLACDSLVEMRGFPAVVMGVTDETDHRLLAFAEAGQTIPALHDALVRGDVPDCVRDILAVRPNTDPQGAAASYKHCPDMTDAKESLATLALKVEHDGRLYGFMITCLPDGDGANPEEYSLLEEVAGDLAFALHGMTITADRNRSAFVLADTEDQLRQAQKLEAVGLLAGGVAHDFNNILTVQIGYCDLMMAALRKEDPIAQDLAQVRTCADRATTLTRQLLAFSRKQALRPEVLDFNAAVTRIEGMLRRLIGEDISLKAVLADGLGRVMVDPGQIEQVIMNLAVNARDAMPQGGRLTLTTANVELPLRQSQPGIEEISGPCVMLEVSDTGCGMSEETQQHLFEPFFTTKEKGKGPGLGLATVYGIVKQSGGHVQVESKQGAGTTFKIYLPRVEADLTSRAEIDQPAIHGSGEVILLVEDETMLRDLLQKMLRQLGYRARVAANGGEALIAVEEEGVRPALLITDVVMPGMNGRVLAARLRQKQPDLKVLYISGYTNDAAVLREITESGSPFLQKPFHILELAAKIRELLGA